MGEKIKEEFDQLISTISLEIMKEKPLKHFHTAVDELKAESKTSFQDLKYLKKEMISYKKESEEKNNEIIQRINENQQTSDEGIKQLVNKMNVIKKRGNFLTVIAVFQFAMIAFLVYSISVG